MPMSTTKPNYPCFSADVRMKLHINGAAHSIGQLGPDFIIMDDPCEHPPGEAEIVVAINGRERRWTVQLPQGIHPDRLRTATVRCSIGERAAAG